MSRDAGRASAVGLAALWPAGAILAMANEEVDLVTTPVFLALDACYLLAAAALLAGRGARGRGSVGLLAATPVALFGLAGFTGAPTGTEPDLLLLNTATLLGVSLLLMIAVTELVHRYRSSGAAPVAVCALVVFVVGSAGYVVNLLGRVAVVLSGLGERQAELEGDYWDASSYLRGLPPAGDPLAYVLTWMDLVQLAYVASAYAVTGALGRLLAREGVASERAGKWVGIASWSALGLLVGSIGLAVALPSTTDAVPAGIAFGLSIPFMTTLLPFALGASALARPPR